MQKNGNEKNPGEQIPKTSMPDLLKTYGNWRKKLQRANAKPRKQVYLDRI